jgi:hypothetical protein
VGLEDPARRASPPRREGHLRARRRHRPAVGMGWHIPRSAADPAPSFLLS